MQKKKTFLSFSLKDTLTAFLILAMAFITCFVITYIDAGTNAISMVFILAVFLVSRFTTGYFYGIVSSLISVLGVNFVFTYPYLAFNFTLSGYPVAIISMLAVSIITSMLTTQIKQQEKIRSEAETEKMRGNLLRSVSHDLRTPLTSILGSTSAIIENDDVISKEERIQLLSGMKEDVQWLIQMVENLLSITRINSDGNTKIIKRSESAEEVLADVVQKFHKRFPDMPVKVSVPDELLIIPMDVTLIEQVITNLLENTVIHAKTATEIELCVVDKNEFAVFKVSDNGIGLSNEILPHIFESQIYHNKTENADGKRNMGIGLSVCNTIIKAHGGVMTAENSKNGGAIFRFTLPKEGSSEWTTNIQS